MASVLEGCGRYSDDLTEISNIILEEKNKNGERITEQDRINTENDIFMAYQQILIKLINYPEGIGTAINLLKTQIQKTPDIVYIDKMATESVAITISEAVKVNPEKFIKEELKQNVAEDILHTNEISQILIKDEIIDTSLENRTIDIVFDENIIRNVEEKIELAAEGDEKAVEELASMESAMQALAFESSPIGNRKQMSSAMRLIATGSKENTEMVMKMAKKNNWDILKTDGDGNITIDEEKLEKLWQEEMEKIPNYNGPKTIKDYKEVNKRKAEKKSKNSDYKTDEKLDYKGMKRASIERAKKDQKTREKRRIRRIEKSKQSKITLDEINEIIDSTKELEVMSETKETRIMIEEEKQRNTEELIDYQQI